MGVAIKADVFERASGVPVRLAELGVDVTVGRLDVADYVLPNGVLVERKRVRDLHLALCDGRFWPQIGRLRRAATLPVLLVAGFDIDDGPMQGSAVRGALVTVTFMRVAIVRSLNAQDSAIWLYRLGARAARADPHRDRPAYAQGPKMRRCGSASEAMLAGVPGISVTLARAVLERFGSIKNLIGATPEELLQVPGMGPTRVRQLRTTLGLDVGDLHGP